MTETERQAREHTCPNGHTWLEHRRDQHNCPVCRPAAPGHWDWVNDPERRL